MAESEFMGVPVSEIVELRDQLRYGRKLLPLRKYEVYYIISVDQNDLEKVDVFTADNHIFEVGRNRFFNAGNVIREYQIPLLRIIVTPVEASDLPQ